MNGTYGCMRVAGGCGGCSALGPLDARRELCTCVINGCNAFAPAAPGTTTPANAAARHGLWQIGLTVVIPLVI